MNKSKTIIEKRLELLDKISDLLEQHEQETEDTNLTGCIMQFANIGDSKKDVWFEWDGDAFQAWDGYEAKKVKIDDRDK